MIRTLLFLTIFSSSLITLAQNSGTYGKATTPPEKKASMNSPEKKFTYPKTVAISKDRLLNKIKGGWAGQTIGVCYGGPSEFKFATLIQDYFPIRYDSNIVARYYNNDDIYMDLTFVGVFDRLGLDAPVDSFAIAFAHAGYQLWHANQAGRYNILNGIKPPMSGFWKNNPHADDIDYQIESDFAGLMSPGMPNYASAISDKIGHIMNYGDGWYGGVFVGAMYSMAFITDDVWVVVTEALKTIPPESDFRQCVQTVIDCYKKDPLDWKSAWFEIEKKWTEDKGCPDGVFSGFNIDAKINAAYIVTGLLFGHGDFAKTIDIATRTGQDSDCNPANAGGILGTLIGYDHIPANFIEPVKYIENKKLLFTPYSLNEVYQVGLKHCLLTIERNGGKIDGKEVIIAVQVPQVVRFEKNFDGIKPVAMIGTQWDSHSLTANDNSYKLSFEGSGIVIRGESLVNEKTLKAYTNMIEIRIDGKPADTAVMPSNFHDRKPEIYWNYDLSQGKHEIVLRIINPAEGASVKINNCIVYVKQ